MSAYREAIERVRQAAPGDPVDVTLTAADLEGLARAYLDHKPDLDVRDVGVEIVPPGVRIRGVTALLGRDMRVSVLGVPLARDDRIRVEVQRVEVNGAPAPKFATSEITSFLIEKFASPKLLIDVASISVEPGAVRVTGRRSSDPAT